MGIYWDEVVHRALDDGALGFPALPIADAGTIGLGEQLYILGYPLAGGKAINYTPAALGGFDENGAMLKANVRSTRATAAVRPWWRATASTRSPAWWC